MATKFYKCAHCGNVIVKTVDSGVPVVCCGQKMEELVPNTVDASQEKHVPVVTALEGGKLRIEVGSVLHPMSTEHHIAFSGRDAHCEQSAFFGRDAYSEQPGVSCGRQKRPDGR